MGGGSLSLSTSPHRRSLEALGLLHNPGGRSISLRVGDVDVYVDVDVGRIGKKNFKVVPHSGRPPSRALSSRSLSGLGLYAYIVKIARYQLHCIGFNVNSFRTISIQPGRCFSLCRQYFR